jgi:hypothetical protein
MAGGSPKHHMDWMGYCLGDCSGAAILAFKNFEVTSLRPPGVRQAARVATPVNETVVGIVWARERRMLAQPAKS